MVYPEITYLGPAHPEGPSRIGTMTRELDRRVSDGIHVRLLWHPHDARVSVAVHDTKTGDAFELPVPDGRQARDVFHHPYAYADWRHARATAPASSALSISVTTHPIGRTRPARDKAS
jgi:hypothetical protein